MVGRVRCSFPLLDFSGDAPRAVRSLGSISSGKKEGHRNKCSHFRKRCKNARQQHRKNVFHACRSREANFYRLASFCFITRRFNPQ
jgi:hypothetical protein